MVDRRKLSHSQPKADNLIDEVVAGGEKYVFKVVPNCHVCTSIYHTQIDRDLVNGCTYSSIFRHYHPLDPRVTYDSVRNHDNRQHLPYKEAAIRATILKRANESGLNFIDGEQRIITSAAFLDTVLERGFERIVSGEAQPTINDTMQAIRLKQLTESSELTSIDATIALAQLNMIILAVREVVPPEYWSLIVERVDMKRKQKALVQGVEGA